MLIDENFNEINKRIESLNKEAQSLAAAAAAVAVVGQVIIKNGGKVLEEKPTFDTMDSIQGSSGLLTWLTPMSRWALSEMT